MHNSADNLDRPGPLSMSAAVSLGATVPKMFGYFDINGRRVKLGNTYRSRLHHIDNLQAAHEYCNRPKGNTPDVSKWRHPMLWPLPVARKQSPVHSPSRLAAKHGVEVVVTRHRNTSRSRLNVVEQSAVGAYFRPNARL